MAPQSVDRHLAVLWVKTHVVRLCLPALPLEKEPRMTPAGWAWIEPCPDLVCPVAWWLSGPSWAALGATLSGLAVLDMGGTSAVRQGLSEVPRGRAWQ